MAEKNKKRGGRRAHLNDFHVNLAGDYVYTGAHYSYVDQGRSRDRVQRELLGLSVAVMLAVVAGWIAPVFAPLGFDDWRISTALVTGVMAKESVVSTLSVLFGSTATLGAGSANDITLAEAGNAFATVAITSANHVSLRDGGALLGERRPLGREAV